jgi:Aspartyl protease
MLPDCCLRWPKRGQHLSRPDVGALLIVSLMLMLLLAACGTSSASNATQGISEHVKVVTGQNRATAVLLPVTIHGQGPFTFELDTGASTSLIAAGLARQLGLPPAGSPQSISGIGGVVQSTPVNISAWSTGPIHLPKATIASAPMPLERGPGLQGLIGSDIWSQFGTLTLDYRSGTLTVYKQIALAPKDRRLAPVSRGV